MAVEDVAHNGICAQMREVSLDTTACKEHDNTSSAQDDTHRANAAQEPHQQHMRLGKKDTAATPGLDTMPAELLFKIDECLDNTSALSLRLASRRMQEVFAYTGNRNRAICTKRASRALRRLIIKDAAKAEKSGRVLVEDALEAAKEGRVHPGLMQACTSCKGFHAINCFSMEQLQKPPAHRLCLGHERVLRLCDHWFLTYFQLAELPRGEPLRRHWTEWPNFVPNTPFRCGCFRSLSKREKELPQSTPTLRPGPRPEHKSIQISSNTVRKVWDIASWMDSRLDDKQAIISILLDKGMICPHLHAGTLDDHVTEATFSQASEHEESGKKMGIKYGQCKVPHCGAKFSLHWEIDGAYMPRLAVRLEVSRQAEIFSMNGPEWLANTEVIDWWIRNLAM